MSRNKQSLLAKIKSALEPSQPLTYPSASIMLEVSREEYQRERERTNTLDNKANVFLSAIIAIVTLFVPIIPFAKLIGVYTSGNIALIVTVTVMLCVLTAAVVFLFLAFSSLYRAFQLKAFSGVNVDNLNDEELLEQPEDVVEAGLTNHYHTILKANSEINDEKAERITAGLKFSIVSFALLCLSAVGLIITIGG